MQFNGFSSVPLVCKLATVWSAWMYRSSFRVTDLIYRLSCSSSCWSKYRRNNQPLFSGLGECEILLFFRIMALRHGRYRDAFHHLGQCFFLENKNFLGLHAVLGHLYGAEISAGKQITWLFGVRCLWLNHWCRWSNERRHGHASNILHQRIQTILLS